MSAFGLTLVLLAACCHATWNFYVKRINGGPELVWLFSFVSVCIYSPLAVYIWFYENQNIGAKEWLFILGSAVIHLAYFLLLQQGYRKGDLSLVYPTARATGPLLSASMAVIVLGEQITPQVLTGGLSIILGVLFLTGGFSKRAKNVSSSLLFGLGVGVLIGSYTVWDAYSVSILLIPPLLIDYFSSVLRCIVLAPYALNRKSLIEGYWRDHRKGVLYIALFNPLAYILVLYALTFTPVIYVAPAREVSVLIAVLAGVFILKEGHFGKRMFWSLLIFCGMVLLALG